MQKSISEHITPEADGQQQQINISHNIQDLSVGGGGMVSWHVRDKFTALQWPPQLPHVMDAVDKSAVTL